MCAWRIIAAGVSQIWVWRGLDRRTIAQALAADRLADTVRELKVLVETAKAGEARGEAFARLRSDAEAGGRRMLALMVALAEARDQGDDIRPLETELAAEERRTGERRRRPGPATPHRTRAARPKQRRWQPGSHCPPQNAVNAGRLVACPP